MYENLQLAGVRFEVKAESPELEDAEDPQGRAWFKVKDASVQFRGAGGFLVRRLGYPDKYVPSPEAVLAIISQ